MGLMDKLSKSLGMSVLEHTAQQESISMLEACDPSLNWALCGGFPRNRLIVLAGDSGSGKTTMGIKHLAQIQKEDKDAIVFIIDTEFYLKDKPERVKRLQKMGLDLSRVLILYTNEPSEVFSVLPKIEQEMKNGAPIRGGIVDSLGGVSPKAQEDRIEAGEVEKAGNQYGGTAKMIASTVKLMVRIAAESQCTIFAVQHAMDDMSQSYGRPKKIIKGGQTLRLLSDVMILFSSINAKDSKIDLNGEVANTKTKAFIGKKIRAKVDKCRDGVEGRCAEFTVNFVDGEVMFKERSLWEVAKTIGVVYHPVNESGAENKMMWNYMVGNEEKSIRGEPKGIESLADDVCFKAVYEACLNSKTKNETEDDYILEKGE